MSIRDKVFKMGKLKLADGISDFLESYTTPAFSSLPKSEVDLMVVVLMQKIGLLSEHLDVYELVRKLKMTNAKARNLIYALEVRNTTSRQLDDLLRKELKKPIVINHGSTFAFDIASPLLLDHIKHKLRESGHYSDGSFSPNVVKLSHVGAVGLLKAVLSESEQESVVLFLRKHGLKDSSFSGLMGRVFNSVGAGIKDKSSDAVSGYFVDFMKGLIDGKFNSHLKSILKLLML
jgi:hypothetical protein